MPIRAVVFDFGETPFDETRIWAAWADWFGVPPLTLFGVLGGSIERREDYRRLFEIMRPGSTFRQERAARAAAGRDFTPDATDLYPDAGPCIAALRAVGYRIGIAGNQPQSAEQVLNAMGWDVDMVASSQRWGVEKPSPVFFDLVVRTMGVDAAEIAYVGDRVDNDVVPAVRAGMIGVFLRRGPWGYLHADRPEASLAHLRLYSLANLPTALVDFETARSSVNREESRP